MAEWSNAAVLKTVVPQGTGGSNPSFSAKAKYITIRESGWFFVFRHCEKGLHMRAMCLKTKTIPPGIAFYFALKLPLTGSRGALRRVIPFHTSTWLIIRGSTRAQLGSQLNERELDQLRFNSFFVRLKWGWGLENSWKMFSLWKEKNMVWESWWIGTGEERETNNLIVYFKDTNTIL